LLRIAAARGPCRIVLGTYWIVLGTYWNVRVYNSSSKQLWAHIGQSVASGVNFPPTAILWRWPTPTARSVGCAGVTGGACRSIASMLVDGQPVRITGFEQTSAREAEGRAVVSLPRHHVVVALMAHSGDLPSAPATFSLKFEDPTGRCLTPEGRDLQP
jgi:hypothetical protein